MSKPHASRGVSTRAAFDSAGSIAGANALAFAAARRLRSGASERGGATTRPSRASTSLRHCPASATPSSSRSVSGNSAPSRPFVAEAFAFDFAAAPTSLSASTSIVAERDASALSNKRKRQTKEYEQTKKVKQKNDHRRTRSRAVARRSRPARRRAPLRARAARRGVASGAPPPLRAPRRPHRPLPSMRASKAPQRSPPRLAKSCATAFDSHRATTVSQ